MEGKSRPRRGRAAWIIAWLMLGTTSSFAGDLSLLLHKAGLAVPKGHVLAPEFQLADMEDKPVSLENLRRKFVLLNFWATWCKPCVVEMPELEKIHRQYRNADFMVLSVNYGESKEKVKAFMTRNRLTFPVLMDPEKKVSLLYKTFSIPTSYIIDRDGYMLGGAIGTMDLDSEDFHTLVEALVNSKGSRQ